MTELQLLQKLKDKFGAAKKGNNGWINIRCPTCNPKDALKMKRGVHSKTLSTNCFICKEPLSLTQLFGSDDIIRSAQPVHFEIKEHPQAREWPCDAIVPVSALPKTHDAVRFLLKDHITDLDRIYRQYQVGYICKEDSKYITFNKDHGTGVSISSADSLVFPVFKHNEFVGWQLRFLNPKSKKFKYLHVFPKGNYLYNYDNAKQYKMVVVVEGVKKSWKFPNGVATFGKGLSQQQIQMIQEWDEIVFMMDGEDDTQDKIKELVNVINRNKPCINIDPRDYGFASPDDMPEDEAQSIVYREWLKAGYE